MDDIFRSLFVAYAVAQSLYPSLQTTGFPVNKLIVNTNSGPMIDPKKVRNRIISVYLKTVRHARFVKTKSEKIRIERNSKPFPLAKIDSGKDYILPLILLRFKAACGYPRGGENFKVALARSFSRSAEPYFSRRLNNLAA